MRKWLIACGALTVAMISPGFAAADTFDLHWFWDQRCEDCHGHAGAFARNALSVEDGKLVGRHHRDDLMLFLQNHGVPASRVKPVYDMLLAQAETGPRFKDKCGNCHENAAALVRESVVLRDGVLVGRESGRPVAEFLKRHGKLGQDEVPFFVDLLARIEQEVHSPY
ncbi:hypothetical protein [Azospirillum sp.]|uniref:hypothetical protein n=1 Tax=Azospirillum sp. TaxID=34012 RepID=UPI003D73FEA6